MKNWYFLSPLILQKLIWVPTRLLLLFCGHVEIRGLEHLKDLHTNVIFACNHSSEMDVFMVPGCLPFLSRFSPIFYTSREQAFYRRAGWRQKFYGGAFFNIWGAYSVKVGLNDYAKSLETHIGIIKHGGNLCIFPEGRTTPDGTVKEGKGGVAYLSYATGRPIVPVHISGTFRLTPADFFMGRRSITVSFGEPIRSIVRTGAIPSIEALKVQANQVMDTIRALGPVSTTPVFVPVFDVKTVG